ANAIISLSLASCPTSWCIGLDGGALLWANGNPWQPEASVAWFVASSRSFCSLSHWLKAGGSSSSEGGSHFSLARILPSWFAVFSTFCGCSFFLNLHAQGFLIRCR